MDGDMGHLPGDVGNDCARELRALGRDLGFCQGFGHPRPSWRTLVEVLWQLIKDALHWNCPHVPPSMFLVSSVQDPPFTTVTPLVPYSCLCHPTFSPILLSSKSRSHSCLLSLSFLLCLVAIPLFPVPYSLPHSCSSIPRPFARHSAQPAFPFLYSLSRCYIPVHSSVAVCPFLILFLPS